MVNTLPAESRYTAGGLYIATRDFQPTHSEREPIPNNTLHTWRNYEVEIMVKVVICLTRKTSGNRIYSLQHRIKKGHRINGDGSMFTYDFHISHLFILYMYTDKKENKIFLMY